MKEFKVTNTKKPGALVVKANVQGKDQLHLPLDKEVELTKDEYRLYQRALAKLGKYLKVEKVGGKKGSKASPNKPLDPPVEPGNDQKPADAKPNADEVKDAVKGSKKKKVRKKAASKKKTTRRKKA